MKVLVKVILFFCFISIAILSCESQQEDQNEGLKKGESLAKIYCGSCHKFPEPSLLNKATWKEHMLPRMG